MKFLSIILLAAFVGVSGKKEEELPPEPTMAFVHHLTLSDSKICGDGETVQIECGLNIMERLPIPEDAFEEEKKEKDKDKPENQPENRLRRRLPKEEEEEKEPEEIKLFSSDVYEMEITNCTNSIKGQNRTLKYSGRQLIVEAEGFQNIDVASVDPYNNTESLMTRQGRIMFWEPPTDVQKLMGYNKSDHIGNLLFKVVVERKKVIDQTEMFVGMTLTMQAMADAIMLNDTGIMFPEPVATYKNYTRVISAELDWEHLVSVACSPEKFATAMPTPQPTPAPSQNPSAPSIPPSMVPSTVPSGSQVPSDMPSQVPSPAPSDTPSSIPSDIPSGVPSHFPSAMPSTLPSPSPTLLPSPLPSTVPTSPPTSGPTSAPSSRYALLLGTSQTNPQNNAAVPDGATTNNNSGGTTTSSGTSPSRGPSTQQQFNRPLFDQDSVVEYTREYYGDEMNPHDGEKPDLIIP